MRAIDRLKEYEFEDFDAIILKIRNGKIKAGRYAHLVKIDKDQKIKGKELFNDGNQGKQEQ